MVDQTALNYSLGRELIRSLLFLILEAVMSVVYLLAITTLSPKTKRQTVKF